VSVLLVGLSLEWVKSVPQKQLTELGPNPIKKKGTFPPTEYPGKLTLTIKKGWVKKKKNHISFHINFKLATNGRIWRIVGVMSTTWPLWTPCVQEVGALVSVLAIYLYWKIIYWSSLKMGLTWTVSRYLRTKYFTFCTDDGALSYTIITYTTRINLYTKYENTGRIDQTF